MKSIIILSLITLAAAALQGCTPVVVGGAAASASAAHDRRTVGTFVEDQEIEIKAFNIKNKHPEISDHSQISVTSYNLVVLLTGQVDDPAVSSRYEALVTEIPRVKRVVNEITVGPFASLGARSKDTYITAKATLALAQVESTGFDPTRVKVVTENGVVYLMGLMTRDEAQERVERLGGRATSSVSGQTDYLVVGENPGSKLDEAGRHGVKVLDEEGFERLTTKQAR